MSNSITGYAPVPDSNPEQEMVHLKLFITGASPNSGRAVINTREICDRHLKGRYILDIIDVYQQPEIARAEQIVALPLLVWKSPLPERRLIGDMSDTQKVVKYLNF